MTATASPLVSILIPVYNGSNFLRDAIESALAQTYSSCEVIVVNDGSTDGGATATIAREYGDRIRYFEKPNGGVASALNFGIREMRGEFLSWLSHDDLYEPGKVETQVRACFGRGFTDRVIVYSNSVMIDVRGRPLRTTRHQDRFSQAQLEIPMFVLINGLVHGCALLISKDLLKADLMFDESLRTTQDYDLWNRLFRRARFIFVPEPLILARQHAEQGSHTIPGQRREMIKLWTEIYNSITTNEMELMYGSIAKYFEEVLKFERQYLRVAEVYGLLNRLRERLDRKAVVSGVQWRCRYVALKTRATIRDLVRD